MSKTEHASAGQIGKAFEGFEKMVPLLREHCKDRAGEVYLL